MSGLKGVFEQLALRRNNQKLRDRLISEGRIRGATPRVLTVKQARKEAELDKAIAKQGLLKQQGILSQGAALAGLSAR